MPPMTPIAKLKAQLFSALLEKNRSDLTDTEIDMMYTLSQDSDIQKVLSAAVKI